jgi:hypothetical protein
MMPSSPTHSAAPSSAPHSVFVDVVAVLEMAVPLVHMVDVVAVLDGFAAVARRVVARVHGVDCLFAVVLSAVHVVDVVAVLNGFAAVAREMFVIGLSRVLSHRILLRRPSRPSSPRLTSVKNGVGQTWCTSLLCAPVA